MHVDSWRALTESPTPDARPQEPALNKATEVAARNSAKVAARRIFLGGRSRDEGAAP